MATPEVVKLKNSVTELDHASGPATAPVTLLEYGNFECIHCGRVYPVIKQVRSLADGGGATTGHSATRSVH
jgi:protein-disulfide isomerase